MYPETGYTSPNELGIIIENNRPVVSSRKVAEVFEKEHNIVMRSIRELGCDDDFSRCNFAQSTYMSDRGKEYPEYLMTRLGFSVLIMTNELGIVIENNRPVVSSRKVAEVFEKEHKLVMRSIRDLDCSPEFAGCNFAPGSYKDAQNQERPEYLMTRDMTAAPLMRQT